MQHVQMLIELSVVIPVINESKNLRELIPAIISDVGPVVEDYEIIIVDDSSTDDTISVLRQMMATNDKIHLISRLGKMPSLPESISEGISSARFDTIAWMDGDGSMPSSALRNIVKKYLERVEPASVLVGSRFVSGGGVKGSNLSESNGIRATRRNLQDSNDIFLAVALSSALNKYLWLTCGRFCRDMTSGFVVTDKQLVGKCEIQGTYGDYFVRFLYSARNQGARIIEVPYTCLPRRHGISKSGSTLIQLLRRGINYVTLPLKLRIH